MALTPPLQSVVDFLRKGYPQGVPDRDYIPLFALLRRRLSDDEVIAIANDLADSAPDEQTTIAIREAITYVTNELPSETDVDRVRHQLTAVGWDPPATAPA